MPFYNASIKARTGSPLQPKAAGGSTTLSGDPAAANSHGAEGKTSTILSALSNSTSTAAAQAAEEPSYPSSPTPEVKDDDASRPTSPLPSPRQLSPQPKDLRAFEHERQKAKRAGEWALKKARKSSPGMGAPNAGSKKTADHNGHARTGSTGAKVGREDVDVEFVLGGRRKLSATGTKEEPGPLAFAIAGAALVSPTPAPKPKVDPRPLSVSLSDLIVPPKPKSQTKAKAKKSKAKSKSNLSRFGSLGSRRKGPITGEDDTFSYASTDVDLDALDDEDEEEEEEFEWVPALRAVIALDEVDPHGRRDMEVDEPWECVGPDGEGEKGEKKGLSYAEVLSGVHLD